MTGSIDNYIYTGGSDTTGTDMNDFIFGFNISDTIDGGGGDDILKIFGYANDLLGGAGSDIIISFGSYNDLYGGYKTVEAVVEEEVLDATVDPLPGEVNDAPVDDIPTEMDGDKLISFGSHNDLYGDVGAYSLSVIAGEGTNASLDNFDASFGMAGVHHNLLIAIGCYNTLVGNVGDFNLDVQGGDVSIDGATGNMNFVIDASASLINANILFGNDFLKAYGHGNTLIGDVENWSLTQTVGMVEIVDSIIPDASIEAEANFTGSTVTYGDDTLKSYGKYAKLIGDVENWSLTQAAGMAVIVDNVIAQETSTEIETVANFTGNAVTYGDDTLKSYGKYAKLIGDVENWTQTSSGDAVTASGNESQVDIDAIGNFNQDLLINIGSDIELEAGVEVRFNTFSYGDDTLISEGYKALLIGDVQDWTMSATVATITMADNTLTREVESSPNATVNDLSFIVTNAHDIELAFGYGLNTNNYIYGDDNLASEGHHARLIGDVQHWTFSLAGGAVQFDGNTLSVSAASLATADAFIAGTTASAAADIDVRQESVLIINTFSSTYGADTLTSTGYGAVLIGDVQDWEIGATAGTTSADNNTLIAEAQTDDSNPDVMNQASATILLRDIDGLLQVATLQVDYGDDSLTSAGNNARLIGDVQDWSLALTAGTVTVSDMVLTTTSTGTLASADIRATLSAEVNSNNGEHWYGADTLSSTGDNAVLIGDVQDWSLMLAGGSVTVSDTTLTANSGDIEVTLDAFAEFAVNDIIYGDDTLTSHGNRAVLIGDTQSWSLALIGGAVDIDITANGFSLVAGDASVIFDDGIIIYGNDTLTVDSDTLDENILIGDAAFMDISLTAGPTNLVLMGTGSASLEASAEIINTTLTLGDDILVGSQSDDQMWGDIGGFHGDIDGTDYGNWDGVTPADDDVESLPDLDSLDKQDVIDFLDAAGANNELTGGNDCYVFDISTLIGDDTIFDFDVDDDAIAADDTLLFTDDVLNFDCDAADLAELDALLEFNFGDDGNGNLQVEVVEISSTDSLGTINFNNIDAPVAPINGGDSSDFATFGINVGADLV